MRRLLIRLMNRGDGKELGIDTDVPDAEPAVSAHE
jgi:hypothetical protein